MSKPTIAQLEKWIEEGRDVELLPGGEVRDREPEPEPEPEPPKPPPPCVRTVDLTGWTMKEIERNGVLLVSDEDYKPNRWICYVGGRTKAYRIMRFDNGLGEALAWVNEEYFKPPAADEEPEADEEKDA